MYENIFEELKAPPHWVIWRGEKINNRITKVPYQAGAGRGYKASATDPKHWTDFNTAVQYLSAIKETPWARESLIQPGIGFVITREAGVLFIDMDHVIVEGRTSAKVAAWINALGGIAEVSPSQTGFHIFVKGQAPFPETGKRHGDFEFYCAKRYSTITGNYVTVSEDGTITPLPESETPRMAEPDFSSILWFFEQAWEIKRPVSFCLYFHKKRRGGECGKQA